MIKKQIKQLSQWYGDGVDGTCPTPEQWESLVALPDNTPIVLINLFKLRENAVYNNNAQQEKIVTGKDAFDLYAAVSIPALEKSGGKFLHLGKYNNMFIGSDEDWDIVAIGSYPNLHSLIALYQDSQYHESFCHRSAACEKQKVFIASN